MDVKVLLKGMSVGFAVFVGTCISEYMKGEFDLTSTSILILFFASMIAGCLGSLLDAKIRHAKKVGPNTTEFKWYDTPVLWLGLPIAVLCLYIVLN